MSPYIKTFEIPPQQKNEVLIAGGGVNPELTESVADSLGLPVVDVELKRHPNDELYVRYDESVRGKDVYVIQSHASANGYMIEEAVTEHLFLTSAAAGASANSVIAIPPYLAHSRGDRKSRGREVVPAPLLIQFYEAAGADYMLSVDLHAKQTAEHLRRPARSYEHLTAQPEIRQAVREYLGSEAVRNCVVVAPDAGSMRNNNKHAKELSKEEKTDVRVIFLDKERARGDSSRLTRLARKVVDVEGKICLTFDDMIDGGGTMVSAAEILKDSGAEQVIVGATHAIFSGRATERLMDEAIDKVFVTDTLPVSKAKEEMGEKLEIVRIGPLIGRAIYEMLTKGSVSEIHAEQNFS